MKKHTEKIDLLMGIPYSTIHVVKNGKITQQTVVPYHEITKRINAMRRNLKEKGYIYVNGKLIRTSTIILR